MYLSVMIGQFLVAVRREIQEKEQPSDGVLAFEQLMFVFIWAYGAYTIYV